MKSNKLESMSADELWDLYELVASVLARRMEAERTVLEDRLLKLSSVATSIGPKRRAYPKVAPKYFNPQNREETWAGRGKRPRWLEAQLRSGKRLDDFLIRRTFA